MIRALALIVLGVLAIAGAAAWGGFGAPRIMPSYLAAWLFVVWLSIGALVLLLVLEVGGWRLHGSVWGLRGLALGSPLALLLVVPVLAQLAPLYSWTGAGEGPGAPFGEAWLQTWPFIGRTVGYLLITTVIALLFAPARSPGSRRAGALLSLFVLAIVATLGFMDWAMSLDPDLHSGEFGLLLIGASCASATAAAILLARAAGLPVTRGMVLLLAGASGAWMYLHFMHFLVMWSADLPKEVTWLQARDADAGRTIEWFGFAGGFLLPLALTVLPRGLQALALAPVALVVLVAHMLEALWFVTPAFRQHFALRGPDALMVVGLTAFVLGLAALLPMPQPAMAAAETA